MNQNPRETAGEWIRPNTAGCKVIVNHVPCLNDTNCFCERLPGFRCVYDHDEKKRFCMRTEGQNPDHLHSTTPQLTSTTTNPQPSKPPSKDEVTNEGAWSILKVGTNSPDEGQIGEITHTKTIPSAKSPWDSSAGKENRVMVTASKELKFDLSVESLGKIMNELNKYGY